MSITLTRLLIVVALVAAGCSSSDGRVLSRPDVTATTALVVEAPVVTEEFDPTALTLFSPDFGDYEELPVQFTTDGEGLSPELTWENVPEGAQELAIVVTDPANSTAAHWVAWGLAPSLTGVTSVLPADIKQSANYLGEIGWAPPVPPDGVVHTYVFEIHALSAPLDLEPGGDPQDAIARIYELSMGSAELVGLLI